jgi:hypothetical protein
MIEFFVGLSVGLLVALFVWIRADTEQTLLNQAIYAGDAEPDENGNIGWVIK